MEYYKIVYKTSENGEYRYPESVKGVVWKIAQYHYTDKVMIGATDKEINADGNDVTKLTEKDALELIENFKSSYPKHDNTNIVLQKPAS